MYLDCRALKGSGPFIGAHCEPTFVLPPAQALEHTDHPVSSSIIHSTSFVLMDDFFGLLY